MTQEQFLTKAVKAANIVLAAGGVASVLALSYILIRHGSTGRPLYYAGPIVVASLLVASLKLTPVYKINLTLLGVSSVLSLYAAEAYLYLSNPTPYETRRAITAIDGARQWKKQRAKQFAKQFGVDFDTQDSDELVMDLRTRGIDAVPFVSPSNFLFTRTIEVGGIAPLGGISNRVTVLCNESGEYVTYTSDRYGFNNPAGLWEAKTIEIAAVGDSFTHGYCVRPEKNFVSAIRGQYPATLNLGVAGDGPLLMLATVKEYLTPLKPKIVLWFYFEGNDLRDLEVQKKMNTLARYLESPFIQGLRDRQGQIDQALIRYAEQEMSIRRQKRGRDDSADLGHLIEFTKLSALRTRSGLISTIDKDEENGVSEANMALFRDVLSQAKNQVETWGGKIYFIYLPTWERYAQRNPGITGGQRTRVLDYARSLGIPLIDVHPAFQTQEDPLSLFPFREPNHYNEKGHRIVADEVLKAISVNERKPLD